jgi:type II secretory pathway pseudopilin PulG
MNKKGLTIVEILVAMIVLLVGVVSVMALFPGAMIGTQKAVKDTIAARIGDSVCDALTRAMRTASPANTKDNKPAQTTLVHDGMTGENSSYIFALPLPADPAPKSVRLFSHPAAQPTSVSDPSPKPNGSFKLGQEGLAKEIIDDIKKGSDPTEIYDQFAFTFTVSRVDDKRPDTETGTNFKPLPLYQFAISVYRLPKAASSGTTSSSTELPKPLKSFIILLSGG